MSVARPNPVFCAKTAPPGLSRTSDSSSNVAAAATTDFISRPSSANEAAANVLKKCIRKNKAGVAYRAVEGGEFWSVDVVVPIQRATRDANVSSGKGVVRRMSVSVGNSVVAFQ